MTEQYDVVQTSPGIRKLKRRHWLFKVPVFSGTAGVVGFTSATFGVGTAFAVGDADG